MAENMQQQVFSMLTDGVPRLELHWLNSVLVKQFEIEVSQNAKCKNAVNETA